MQKTQCIGRSLSIRLSVMFSFCSVTQKGIAVFSRNFCQFFLVSFRVLCYFQHLRKSPITYWLNGRWFLKIVDREF